MVTGPKLSLKLYGFGDGLSPKPKLDECSGKLESNGCELTGEVYGLEDDSRSLKGELKGYLFEGNLKCRVGKVNDL